MKTAFGFVAAASLTLVASDAAGLDKGHLKDMTDEQCAAIAEAFVAPVFYAQATPTGGQHVTTVPAPTPELVTHSQKTLFFFYAPEDARAHDAQLSGGQTAQLAHVMASVIITEMAKVRHAPGSTDANAPDFVLTHAFGPGALSTFEYLVDHETGQPFVAGRDAVRFVPGFTKTDDAIKVQEGLRNISGHVYHRLRTDTAQSLAFILKYAGSDTPVRVFGHSPESLIPQYIALETKRRAKAAAQAAARAQ